MLIAIDYDGTYSADKALWLRFINDAQQSGHTVICATMRFEEELGTVCDKLKKVVRIICTDRKAKKPALLAMGIRPDIWIDDNPEWLFGDAL